MSIVRKKTRLTMLRRAILYLSLSLIAIVTLFPLVLMLVTSLRDGGAIITRLSDMIPDAVTLENFRVIWQEGNFDIYFRNTIIVTAAAVIGNTIFASMAAYVLSRKDFRGKRTLLIIIIGRMMVPIQVLIIPLFILMHRTHLYDTLFALILPTLVQGFGIFLMKQYFDGIPRSLDEAALIDGASDFQVFRMILMPLAKPALAVLAINTALTSWNAFLLPLILTISTESRTLALGLALFRTQFGVDYTQQMAAASLSSLPILVLFLFFQRNIIAGLTKGAIKQ